MRAFLCFEFLTTKIIKHLTIWLGWLRWLTLQRRIIILTIFAPLSWNCSCILSFPNKKAINFVKLDQALSFMSKISSDITKRRSSWDKQEDKRIHDCKLKKQKNSIFCRFYIFININVKEVFFSFCNCSLFPQLYPQ